MVLPPRRLQIGEYCAPCPAGLYDTQAAKTTTARNTQHRHQVIAATVQHIVYDTIWEQPDQVGVAMEAIRQLQGDSATVRRANVARQCAETILAGNCELYKVRLTGKGRGEIVPRIPDLRDEQRRKRGRQ